MKKLSRVAVLFFLVLFMSSLSYKGSLYFSHNLVLEGLGKVKKLANAKEIILAEALQTFYNRTSLDNSVPVKHAAPSLSDPVI